MNDDGIVTNWIIIDIAVAIIIALLLIGVGIWILS
jgi:flagellar biogenesis protein FliO